MSATLLIRDSNLDQYMAEVAKIPLLTRDEETRLATRFHQEGDLSAAHQLVVANLRFVVKIAHEYRNYGFRLLDLVQEGNIGLMVAVKKFDPTKGYRLISYAVWWIRAQIQSYVLRSWSLVKVGTGQARRKLFFKLRSERNKLQSSPHLDRDETSELAERLGVDAAEVQEMELRLAARDFSLDAQLGPDAKVSHLEAMPDTALNQEDILGNLEEEAQVKQEVSKVVDVLNDKERYIVENRLMTSEPKTLQEIGDTFHVSRERVRQLESRVVSKLRERLSSLRQTA